MPKQQYLDHGSEIWGIGYITSDHSEDEDEEGNLEEETGEDCMYNEELRRKILTWGDHGGDALDMDEFEAISSNTRLREIYSYRWWRDEDRENYFVMINKGAHPIKKGEQIFYNYGRRNNSYLFQNYGFCLDESNQYNTLHFRVIIGTNPKAKIDGVRELFPDDKMLGDKDNLETTTEKMKLASHRPSESMMNYLRSVLQNNYEGPDSSYIMISSPRIIEYELMVIDFAIKLLEHYGKSELFARSTLEEDQARFRAVVDYRVKTVLQYNIQRKLIYKSHLKLLIVMRAVLERIQEGVEYSRATIMRVEEVEDRDSEWELYKRRMGLRHYFKELRMNMARIQRAKDARAGWAEGASEKKPKKKKKPEDDTLSVATTESALGKSAEKKPKKEGKTAAHKKASGAAAPAKKKAVKK